MRMAMLVESQRSNYQRDGFLSVADLLACEELQQVRERMQEVAEGRVATFPADQIEFEAAAGDRSVQRAIRKINQCAEHDAVFTAHAANPRILDIVELLIGLDIKLFGSQCFMKPCQRAVDWKWSSARFYLENQVEPRLPDLTLPPAELFVCGGVQVADQS